MAKTDRVHSTPRRTALKIVAGTTARQADPYDEAFLKQYDPALRAINAHRQAVKIHIEAVRVEFCIRGQRDEGGPSRGLKRPQSEACERPSIFLS